MLGIIIVLNVFFMVIRGLAFPEPQYSDFCPATPVAAPMVAPANAPLPPSAPYDNTSATPHIKKLTININLMGSWFY